MDDPSSSSSSLPTDVFLNFRGEDTRKSFVCHLHRALEWETLQVYIDKHDLDKGDNLLNLLKAIAGSKLSIVVFSENYATSTRCLNELVQVLKCKKDHNQIVIPVFYKVDPSHIRKQTGSFGEALAKHENNRKEDKELLQEVQSWRSALQEATDLSGFDSKNYEDDVGLIDDIVKDVFAKVHSISTSPHTEDGFVAMDSHLHKMRQLIDAAPDGVVYVGICGMGGIGKTTIALAFFRENAHQFEHCCFLKNVGERFVGEVQREFLDGMLKKKVDNVDAVYMKMMRKLANKKILVVLDGVLDSGNMDTTLRGSNRSFGAGSIIIVTTRDEHVVCDGFEIYKPMPLSVHDSLKLFSQNAFKTHQPFGEYEHLSRCIVEYAQGLPSALILLGKLLRNRSISEWIVETERLLKQILSFEEVPVCVHGTYRKNLDSILESGLKCMTRLHVHFASGLPTDGEVISGMRRDVNILIFLDIRKALAEGMKFYISDNKVILTEGFDGVVPVKYFEKIESWPSRKPIAF